MNRQIARIEDQLIGGSAVEMECDGTFQNLGVEPHVKVEIEVANTSLAGARCTNGYPCFPW